MSEVVVVVDRLIPGQLPPGTVPDGVSVGRIVVWVGAEKV